MTRVLNIEGKADTCLSLWTMVYKHGIALWQNQYYCLSYTKIEPSSHHAERTLCKTVSISESIVCSL